ncbi:hypothetical protein IEQ34_007241 [Dendrobium chrysotoxum]|uniref:Uncharacterized protein n=1 Tax=Dendrobium chrysotoxum TaxID=161865 RepID=A0AAV7H8R7_DENCH|nr:hypothetical protein IEQ34_007241 [Dendrobium chrysotoxum]
MEKRFEEKMAMISIMQGKVHHVLDTRVKSSPDESIQLYSNNKGIRIEEPEKLKQLAMRIKKIKKNKKKTSDEDRVQVGCKDNLDLSTMEMLKGKRPCYTVGGSQRPVVFKQQEKKSTQGCVAKKEKEQAAVKAIVHPFSFRGTQVDWRGGIKMDLGVIVRAVCGESYTYDNEGGFASICVVWPTRPICSII